MLLSLFNRAKQVPQQQWRISSVLGVRITHRARGLDYHAQHLWRRRSDYQSL
jgi:hypothetical protein